MGRWRGEAKKVTAGDVAGVMEYSQPPPPKPSLTHTRTRAHAEVIKIDREAKKVRAREVVTGKEYDQPYDHLVLSLGAFPARPPLPGLPPPTP